MKYDIAWAELLPRPDAAARCKLQCKAKFRTVASRVCSQMAMLQQHWRSKRTRAARARNEPCEVSRYGSKEEEEVVESRNEGLHALCSLSASVGQCDSAFTKVL